MNKPCHIKTAQKIKEDKYPEAKVLFLAGSVVRGDHTKYSDLDIIVIYDELKCSRRESYIYDSWPVDAFIHTEDTLNYFYQEVNKPRGELSLSQMILESVPIPKQNEFTDRLKCWASKNLSQQPKKPTQEDIERMRYGLTDLIDDLRDFKSTSELYATGARVYEFLSNCYFKVNRIWSGEQKYIPRLLKKHDEVFANKFDTAFEQLFQKNDPQLVISLTDAFLNPIGGYLFDGYLSDAPKSWKLKPQKNHLLKGERLTLRIFKPTDADRVYELLKDGIVSKTTLTMPDPYQKSDASQWIEWQLKEIQKENQLSYAIIKNDSHELIGCMSMLFKKNHSTGELAYWVGSNYWNNGYATEAAKLVIAYAFSKKLINKVKARHMLLNPSSGKVMQKIGLKKEGTLLQEVKRRDGVYHDLNIYGLTKKDYIDQCNTSS